LQTQHAAIKDELLAAVARVIDSGQFILGHEVDEFEQRFAQLCGTRYAVAVNSGTDALILALRTLGIGPGDEVITAPNSFVATAAAIALAGAQPVFVDVGEDYNLDPSLIERAVTPRTRAILPVHLTGRPADMDPILEIADRHGLHVVEDCAQAVGAQYRGRPVGSFGVVGCFSLHPLKTLSACGDGGVLTTSSSEAFERAKVLRNLGLRNRDECVEWSGNTRLDTIQAALLLVKMRHFEEWTAQRRQNATFYMRGLMDVDGVTVPKEDPHGWSVYHTFVIQAERRDELKAYLANAGIETAVHYPTPIHLQEAASELKYPSSSFPNAESQAGRILSLPVYSGLSRESLDYIVDVIEAFYQR
jgi:dTDP-4-amino-4,6-dideoxygalactose transaminase